MTDQPCTKFNRYRTRENMKLINMVTWSQLKPTLYSARLKKLYFVIVHIWDQQRKKCNPRVVSSKPTLVNS